MKNIYPSNKLNRIIESNYKEKYSLEIFISSNLYLDIVIISLDKLPNIKYEEKFTLDKIKDISKYFLICESISDVIYSIEPNINKINLIDEKKKNKINYTY